MSANLEKRRAQHREWYQRNKASQLQYQREHRKQNREHYKLRDFAKQLRLKYKITPEQYQELLLRQGGKCAICKQTWIRRLSVDHDHKTGRIRSLLCNNCNTAIGLLKDDPELCYAAGTYLMRYLELQ